MNTSSKLRVIGISGTNGSGKDSLGLALQERYGYMFIPFTNLLRDEARRRKMPIIRTSTSAISAEWRREFGNDVLVDKSLAMWQEFRPNAEGVALASLRHPAEAERVQKEGGIVLWLDADPHLRYARVRASAAQRGRPEEDLISFDEFIATEEAEMHPVGDSATLDMAGVKVKADEILVNDFPDVEGFVDFVAKKIGL